LAQELNGDLRVVSKKNVGTKFILILPISQQEIEEYRNQKTQKNNLTTMNEYNLQTEENAEAVILQ
jgi:hypothetical protein